MNETFKRTLVFLAQRHATAVQNYAERTLECYEAVVSQVSLYPIAEGTLEHLLTERPLRGEVSTYNTWLFLPAPKRGRLRIPVLEISYNFETEPATVSLQAGIFFFHDASAR